MKILFVSILSDYIDDYHRYERFGHSLDAVDMDGDGEADVMVMMGGYSPTPSNDVWVTEDGITWV